MAAGAVLAKLALVYIRVAGQTFRVLVVVGKLQSLVAGETCESLVPARQGEARFLVVEICILAHFP